MFFKICKKWGLPLLFMGLGQTASSQQDVQFSQYVFNGLAVNPAYAGYKENTYFNAMYRKQWMNIPGAPQTGLISLDGVPNWSHNKNVGLGGQLVWDKTGAQESISLYGNYSYRIRLNEEGTRRLCLGVGLGFTQYSIDGSDLQGLDINDPSLPIGRVNTYKPDARFGVYYYSPNFYAGLSVLDLFTDNIYKTELVSNNYKYLNVRKTRHFYLTAGFTKQLSENVTWKPSVMIRNDFHSPTNIDINNFFLLGSKIWLGASYRTSASIFGNLPSGLDKSTAASVMAEVFATDQLRIGYAYDFALNGLANYQTGTHEISVGIMLPNKKSTHQVIGPRYF